MLTPPPFVFATCLSSLRFFFAWSSRHDYLLSAPPLTASLIAGCHAFLRQLSRRHEFFFLLLIFFRRLSPLPIIVAARQARVEARAR